MAVVLSIAICHHKNSFYEQGLPAKPCSCWGTSLSSGSLHHSVPNFPASILSKTQCTLTLWIKSWLMTKSWALRYKQKFWGEVSKKVSLKYAEELVQALLPTVLLIIPTWNSDLVAGAIIDIHGLWRLRKPCIKEGKSNHIRSPSLWNSWHCSISLRCLPLDSCLLIGVSICSHIS